MLQLKDAMGMLPNGQAKSTADLESPQQLRQLLYYCKPRLANKHYLREVWLYIQQYFVTIESPGLLEAVDKLDGDPLVHVLKTWVGHINLKRLQHFLINHMLYFVMPGLIAAYIANGKWQEVETLIGNVMGIERVRTWMAHRDSHHIDYYGFAMFVATYIAADSDGLPGFLQTMGQKPGVDIQNILDCKPKGMFEIHIHVNQVKYL
ncbi:hypothetical protein H4R34_003187 [Dimargaris verticillata]|uniref:Uncharacterized protein n=1 Tax=Dimargaris verticillata TaxID=2761393 RepID=A0A9W8E9A4_9FUNG|nr:hypothetical protein H4R34_003187 [Dimargaris verticillata]